jgi:hypothetical protein
MDVEREGDETRAYPAAMATSTSQPLTEIANPAVVWRAQNSHPDSPTKAMMFAAALNPLSGDDDNKESDRDRDSVKTRASDRNINNRVIVVVVVLVFVFVRKRGRRERSSRSKRRLGMQIREKHRPRSPDRSSHTWKDDDGHRSVRS